MIAVEIPEDAVELGSRFESRISWQVDGRQPDAVEVRVVWRTEGRGMVDSGTVADERVDLEDDAFATPWASIAVTLPADAPVSYDGQLIRVRWLVEVRLDIPWARDEKHEQFFTVVPAGALRSR